MYKVFTTGTETASAQGSRQRTQRGNLYHVKEIGKYIYLIKKPPETESLLRRFAYLSGGTEFAT